MKASMTKRQYNKTLADIRARTAAANALLESFSAREEAGTLPRTEYDAWNDAHDLLWDLEKELEGLEDAWRRRRWTSVDYQQYELVCDNVD